MDISALTSAEDKPGTGSGLAIVRHLIAFPQRFGFDPIEVSDFLKGFPRVYHMDLFITVKFPLQGLKVNTVSITQLGLLIFNKCIIPDELSCRNVQMA